MEVRCKKCNRLFFRFKRLAGAIEIKCPKCGHAQTIAIAAGKRGDTAQGGICLDKP